MVSIEIMPDFFCYFIKIPNSFKRYSLSIAINKTPQNFVLYIYLLFLMTLRDAWVVFFPDSSGYLYVPACSWWLDWELTLAGLFSLCLSVSFSSFILGYFMARRTEGSVTNGQKVKL